jgi:tRNA (adenine37-N6)-methyltransferase
VVGGTINERGNNVVMAVNTALTKSAREFPMQPEIVLHPVGLVRGGRLQPEDDSWDSESAEIVLDDRFGPDALAGLGDFSHIEVVFHFHQVGDSEIRTGARHPRGRSDWPLVGIFAQRGKGRPNRIGVTICRLLSVEGRVLKVRGLDAIDGTPVIDIKPVLKGFLPRGEIIEPAWASELMKDYW